MTSHYFIATMRAIPEFHEGDNNYSFLSGEAYKEVLPFTLPYTKLGRWSEHIFSVSLSSFSVIVS